MDLIAKALADIMYAIPRDILRLAYMEKELYSMGPVKQAPVSLDENIRQKTLYPRVLVDANIHGGETVIIDLQGIHPKRIDENNYVFEIPGKYVNYRTILSVLSMNYIRSDAMVNSSLQNSTSGVVSGLTALGSAANRAFNSRADIPIISNSECVVVGHNVVMVRNHLISAAMVQMRCVVTNDEHLNNISIRNAPEFSKLCILAVKSFIYNTLIIKMDRGYLEHGQELGIVKTFVEGYADAEEMYQTFLVERWGAVSFMNDRLGYEELLKLQIDPAI